VSGRFSLKDQEIIFDGLQVGFQNPIKLKEKHLYHQLKTMIFTYIILDLKKIY